MKIRNGDGKEIPLVQGKEQQLCIAGAAVKRYTRQGERNPSKMVSVARGHQRVDTLKPYSQKSSQSNHTDQSLVYLNETKPCRVGPPKTDGSWRRGLAECGPREKGMGNHFSIFALRTP